ncbi:cell division protein FtsQ/DivIB [Anaeroselena agilis]|uniref:FtsQ-type POTRA domain-containing protein n=1 Tax=Anaeroselena agilis TaxID=3063788 RepID=A0ABU3NXZ2_9FIRM|nr:FtsQ-type POTRA domain-containing protein [Selenomonadales bacterium 4137-cl]
METREEGQSGLRPTRKLPASTLALLLLALTVIVAAFLFINSTYFAVGTVVVEGNKYISTEDVFGIAGIPSEINIFRLNTTTIRNRLLHDLRIDQAEVARRFPATIVITVSERQPVAWIACSYGFVQLDKQGVVMAAVKNIKKIDVPIITGARLGNVYIGDKIDVPAVKNVLAYLADLDGATLGQLSEVNVRSAGDLVAYTVQTVTIRIGPPDRLAEKAKLTGDILGEVGNKKSAIEYIDLSYASPYIKFRQFPRKE